MRRSWKPPIAIGLFLLESAPEGDDAAARPEDWKVETAVARVAMVAALASLGVGLRKFGLGWLLSFPGLGRSQQLFAVCGVSCLLSWGA